MGGVRSFSNGRPPITTRVVWTTTTITTFSPGSLVTSIATPSWFDSRPRELGNASSSHFFFLKSPDRTYTHVPHAVSHTHGTVWKTRATTRLKRLERLKRLACLTRLTRLLANWPSTFSRLISFL